MKPDHLPLMEFAAQHHGLFRITDVDRLGYARSEIETWVRRRTCESLVRGVYRLTGSPRTEEQALLAMVWLHPRAVASHRSAGRLYDLPPFGPCIPEITVTHGSSRRGGRGVVRTTLTLPDHHLASRHAIPVTSVARTLFDLAGTERPKAVEVALDAALQRNLTTTAEVHRVFFALARRGRRGTVLMRELLEARGESYVPPASELERRARALFRDAGLPEPEFEVALGDDDRIGRVDCYWRPARLVVELDGRRFHGGATARDADRDRDNRLMAAGWRVLRFTWFDIVDRPKWVAQVIRAALDPSVGGARAIERPA